jgi:hypothetical protein
LAVREKAGEQGAKDGQRLPFTARLLLVQRHQSHLTACIDLSIGPCLSQSTVVNILSVDQL